MKKIFSVFLAAVITVAQFAFILPSLSVESEAVQADNKCGDSIIWTVDTVSGVLTLDGEGETYEYKSISAPWDKYADYITSIIVSEGITCLMQGTFDKLNNAISLTLPSTIEEIHTTAAMPALGSIDFSNGKTLYYVSDSFCSKSVWYKNIPDGSLIYFGSLLCGIKGNVPENTSIEIADGTTVIKEKAFYNKLNITDVVFPYSLKYIGFGAFYNTGWYNSQPDGLVYAGSMLLSYKGTMPATESVCIIEDGTKGIAAYAFNDNKVITNVTIPSTVEEIGVQAFSQCLNLSSVIIDNESCLKKIHARAFYGCFEVKDFQIPETVVKIGDEAFTVTGLKYVFIPASVKKLEGAFSQSSNAEFFEVSADNLKYCSDSDGVIFSKDKTILYNVPAKINKTEYAVPSGVKYIYDEAFAYSRLEKIIFNDELQGTGESLFRFCNYLNKLDIGKGLTIICKNMFYNAWSLKEIVIPKSIKYIENEGLYSDRAEKIYILSEDVVFDNKSTTNSKTVIYCYTNSTAHKHAEEYGIKYVLFDDEHYTAEIDTLLLKAEGIYRPNYTDESLAELDEVLDKIDLNAEGLTQYQIDDWCNELETAIGNLEIKKADFSAVDEAIKRAESIDRSLYTEDSLAKLDAAINAVDRTVNNTVTIAAYAQAIEAALSELKIKPADYSKVDEAIKKTESIDRSLYTEDSLAKLDAAINAVDRTVNNTVTIAAYAQAIENAVSALEFKPADYSKVDEAVEKSKSVNRNLYTAESLAVLDDAVADAEYNLTIDRQAQVDELAEEIENAIKNLEYLPADYSSVEKEINKAEKLDRRYYSEVSLVALDEAVNAVEYGLNITAQTKVDAFAKSISAAISALKYASIVLRHEPCGVIVSATTKEIKPDTVLAVEEVDPTNYEGTNFAVGGSIKSLHFYDINLLYKSAIVQPDGRVTVKIKLANGVDPKKCKVYHVTEDIVNPLVRFANTIDGNYVVFETDHFSEFAVIEVETVLDSIEIQSLPLKTEYGIGEQLDLAGMKVIANYSDGTSKAISDYTAGMVDFSAVGTERVIIYYTFGSITKAAEFEVSVSGTKCLADITENGKSVERVSKKLGLFSLYTRASFQLNCEIQNADGCNVRWSSDNSKVIVDENGRVTCKGLFGAKKANITVEIVDADGNVVANDTVYVVFYKLSFQLSGILSQAVGFIRRNIVLR